MKIKINDLIKILSTVSAILTGAGEIIRQVNIYNKKNHKRPKKHEDRI